LERQGKVREFDEDWRVAVATLPLAMKVMSLGMAPLAPSGFCNCQSNIIS